MATINDVEIYDLFSPTNTKCLEWRFGVNVKNSYLQRVEKFFEENSIMSVPTNVKDEFSIIQRESRLLLSKDCAFELYGLVNYLNKQKTHLTSVKTKLGYNDFSYLSISTFVVKVSIFDIEESFSMRQIRLNRMNQYYTYSSELENNAWNAIKILDTYNMLYSYKNDIYNAIRTELESKCILKRVDTRSDKQKQKDVLSNVLDDFSGCVFILIFFLICMLIGAIT